MDESAVWGRYALELRSSVDLPLAEIVSYDAPTALLLATCDDGLAIIDLADPGDAQLLTVIDVAGELGFSGTAAGISHVSVDPLGRGVAAVTVMPAHKGSVPGRLAFVSLERRAIIGSLVVGYGPDACEFSPDGRFLVVANEGEWKARPDGTIDDPPPSVTIVRLEGVTNEFQFETLDEADVRTVHFAGDAMAAVEREGFGFDPARHLRLSPAQRYTPGIDIEPESIAMTNGTAYVSLQENNAVAVIDLETARLERVEALGSVEFVADVSDRDGPSITTTIRGLPMPDQIKAFESGGRVFLVTADEGDNRGEFGRGEPMPDHARLSALDRDGRLSETLAMDVRHAPNGLARLRVCAITGDTDGDGLIDEPYAQGTRGVGVYDARTMERVGGTGSRFARLILENWPALFNAGSTDDPLAPDQRSDDRGCEPEGVAIGELGGRPVAFVGLERPGAVAIVDLASPGEPEVVGFTMLAKLGHLSPEGLAFIGREENALGEPLLVVACEVSGSVTVWRVVDRY